MYTTTSPTAHPAANQRGSAIASLLFILAAAGIFYGLAAHHLVMTRDGLQVYPKRYLTIEDTYVDMRRMEVAELVDHEEVVKAMVDHGHLRYVPGGELVQRMARAGYTMSQVVQQLDRDYRVSDSAREVGRIAQERYQQLDQRYDLQGKAEQAGDKLKEGANRLHQWLERQ